MTRDDIIRMAREAGFLGYESRAEEVNKFAALVAAHEREAEKQEPVAWLYLDSWGTLKLSQIMPVPVGAFPVYTAPPQRQPLTEEELRQCFLATNTAEPLAEGWPGLERFARAIERAHGIGGGE